MLPVEGRQAGEPGRRQPQLIAGIGELVHVDVAGVVAGEGEEQRIVLGVRSAARGDRESIAVAVDLGAGADRDPVAVGGDPGRPGERAEVRVDARAVAANADQAVGCPGADEQRGAELREYARDAAGVDASQRGLGIRGRRRASRDRSGEQVAGALGEARRAREDRLEQLGSRGRGAQARDRCVARHVAQLVEAIGCAELQERADPRDLRRWVGGERRVIGDAPALGGQLLQVLEQDPGRGQPLLRGDLRHRPSRQLAPARDEQQRPGRARPAGKLRIGDVVRGLPRFDHARQRVPGLAIEVDEAGIREEGVQERDAEGVAGGRVDQPQLPLTGIVDSPLEQPAKLRTQPRGDVRSRVRRRATVAVVAACRRAEVLRQLERRAPAHTQYARVR